MLKQEHVLCFLGKEKRWFTLAEVYDGVHKYISSQEAYAAFIQYYSSRNLHQRLDAPMTAKIADGVWELIRRRLRDMRRHKTIEVEYNGRRIARLRALNAPTRPVSSTGVSTDDVLHVLTFTTWKTRTQIVDKLRNKFRMDQVLAWFQRSTHKKAHTHLGQDNPESRRAAAREYVSRVMRHLCAVKLAERKKRNKEWVYCRIRHPFKG